MEKQNVSSAYYTCKELNECILIYPSSVFCIHSVCNFLQFKSLKEDEWEGLNINYADGPF